MVKKALIVDDSNTMRNMVSMAISELGFECITAVDGEDAAELSKGDGFDLVITDINMPKMDGVELIKILRERESFKHTPILVLSTEGCELMKEEGKKAGASGWIVKPFDPRILKIALKNCVKNL